MPGLGRNGLLDVEHAAGDYILGRHERRGVRCEGGLLARAALAGKPYHWLGDIIALVGALDATQREVLGECAVAASIVEHRERRVVLSNAQELIEAEILPLRRIPI